LQHQSLLQVSDARATFGSGRPSRLREHLVATSQEGDSMPASFILIATHKINAGQLGEFRRLSREFEEFLHVNEPDLLAYYAYLDQEQGEVSLVNRP
jgi:hypothetical protein